jgi:hypothetical protein
MATKGKKKGNAIRVDFKGVETKGKFKPLSEGRHILTIQTVEMKTSTNSGHDYLAFMLEETSSKGRVYHNCSLQPQALFNLKGLLVAAGVEVPDSAFDIDLEDLVGLELEAEIEHETYEGDVRARIAQFIDPTDEDEDDEDADDEDDEDDEDEEDVSTQLGEMELDELKELADELGVKYTKKTKKAELVAALMDADGIEEALNGGDEDADDEDDDEDDEGADDDDEDQDYSEMELEELQEECRDRGLKYKKDAKKRDLIRLLEKDDEE